MIGIFGIPLLVLRFAFSPIGMVLMLLASPFMLYNYIYDRLYGPMDAGEVPHYVSIERVVRGSHVTGAAHGEVVTIRITNTHPTRATPDDLWVACTAFGTQGDYGEPLGTYETLVAFEASSMHDYNGDPVPQSVGPSSTKALDFETQAALPSMNLRTGERLGTCVLGATKVQALAVAGHRYGTHDQQGQMLTVTPLGAHFGLETGWQR